MKDLFPIEGWTSAVKGGPFQAITAIDDTFLSSSSIFQYHKIVLHNNRAKPLNSKVNYGNGWEEYGALITLMNWNNFTDNWS